MTLEGDVLGWENQSAKNTDREVSMMWDDRAGFLDVLFWMAPSGHSCLCERAWTVSTMMFFACIFFYTKGKLI